MEFSSDLKYVYLSIQEFCELKKISRCTFYRLYSKKLHLLKAWGKNQKKIRIERELFLNQDF